MMKVRNKSRMEYKKYEQHTKSKIRFKAQTENMQESGEKNNTSIRRKWSGKSKMRWTRKINETKIDK